MKKIFLILPITLLLFGCTDGEVNINERAPDLQSEILQKTVQKCIDLNGVPILSSWNGQVKECQFNVLKVDNNDN